jgi:hypothetical protein
MYGTLLLIAKLLSDALAAFFGMLGLLFDFKDEHKRITKTGRVALIGIVAAFIVSGLITALEAKKSHEEEESHREADVATRQVYERTEAKLQEELKAAYEQGNRKVMRPIPDKIVMHVEFATKNLQVKTLQSADAPSSKEWGLIPHMFNVDLYKNPPACADTIGSTTSDRAFSVREIKPKNDPDWPLTNTHIMRWHDEPFTTAWQDLPLVTIVNRGPVTSIDHLQGSMLVLGGVIDDKSDYTLSKVDIDVATGVKIHLHGNDFRESRRALNPNYGVSYCYVFPQDAKF